MDLATANGLGLLLIGLAAGLVAVAAPGPVSLTVIEIGAANGRRSGLRASAGAVGADAFLAPLAIATVAAGATLPAGLFTGLRLLSVVMLIAIGAALVLRPTACQAMAAGIVNPGRALFAITTLSPSVFGAWLAMLFAMPFSDDPYKLAWFSGGIVLASALYNMGLGAAAGTVGPRLSASRRMQLSRAGGFAMLALAGVAALGL